MDPISKSDSHEILKGSSVRISRAMPARLVMIRHGESEANLINRAMKKGVIAQYPEGFCQTPDREIRLSAEGKKQALATGPWLRAQYPQGFDFVYTSDHTRAKETAAYVCQSAGWHDVQIRIDPLLGERNWGLFPSVDTERRDEIMRTRARDPLHNPMPDGETLLETRNRARELLDRCAREFGDKRVLVFSHGEYIEALWAEIAHMNTERQIDFFKSEQGNLRNCQVVEFSARDPGTDENVEKLRWVRSSCPQAAITGKWSQIERQSFTPEELLIQVERYPRLGFEEERE